MIADPAKPAAQQTTESAPPTRYQNPQDGLCVNCAARAVSICEAMDDEHINILDRLAHKMAIPRGEAFITEGDQAQSLFNITSGTAKIYKLLGDGRRQIIGFLNTGDFLGLSPSACYPFTAEAITDIRICRFRRGRMDEVFNTYPSMRRKILDIASNELAEAQEQMLLLGRKTAREKIASFLIGRLRRAQRLGGAQNSVELLMSRHDIADFLGLTTETVSRTFTQIKHEGVIQLDNTSLVRIVEPETLEMLAGGY